MKINEVLIDNIKGSGATPYNQEVDYRGLRVMMKPSIFLKLALPMNSDSVDRLVDYVAKGGAIGSPFLTIKIPENWKNNNFSEPAQIWTHEGRHRMVACQKVDGDIPMEVHLFFTEGIRARNIKPEWITAMNSQMQSEMGDSGQSYTVKGPIFQIV
jgi:hypothetical protein